MCTRRRRSMTERLVYIFVFIHVFQQERHLQWHNNNNNNNSCGSTSSLSSLPTNALQGGRLLDRPQKCTTGDGQQPQPVSDLLFCADRLYPERNDKQGMLDPWEFKYYGPDPSIDDLDPAKHPLVRRPNNVHEEEEELRCDCLSERIILRTLPPVRHNTCWRMVFCNRHTYVWSRRWCLVNGTQNWSSWATIGWSIHPLTTMMFG